MECLAELVMTADISFTRSRSAELSFPILLLIKNCFSLLSVLWVTITAPYNARLQHLSARRRYLQATSFAAFPEKCFRLSPTLTKL